MLNQITYDRRPDALILDPYRARNLAALVQPEYLWRPIPRTTIAGFAASAHSEINERIDNVLSYSARNKVFSHAIEFNTFPVALKNAWFKKSFVAVEDKCLISGAAGTRLLNRYCWEGGDESAAVEQRLVDYFLDCQNDPAEKVLPVVEAALPQDTPFAIECRNTFNYFHFVTESLCQLCLVAETGLTGPIYLHYPNTGEKTRPFARAFIAALFPELADRVQFQRAPVHHKRVVTPYNFANSFYQMSAAEVGLMDLHAPSNVFWKGRLATRASQGVLAMNSLDSSLIKLRARALRAIEGKDFSHLPRRFWVGREADLARPRRMKGEGDILDMLKMFGFEAVAFERLAPLEQVAIMANAEMMVSYHGAGFTNMLFAGPQAFVVELGTLQTAMFRWGDFWRLANVAQCRYVSFFADFNADDPLREPEFDQDGIVPVHLSPAGLAQVMSFVVGVLGHVPQFSRPDEVMRLGAQLMKVGALDRAQALYAAHDGMQKGHVGLSLAMAEAHDRAGEHFKQLAALHSAFGADPTSWTVLIRIVWCARSLDLTETLRAALLALQDGFPDRFAAFAKDRPWVRKHLADEAEIRAS